MSRFPGSTRRLFSTVCSRLKPQQLVPDGQSGVKEHESQKQHNPTGREGKPGSPRISRRPLLAVRGSEHKQIYYRTKFATSSLVRLAYSLSETWPDNMRLHKAWKPMSSTSGSPDEGQDVIPMTSNFIVEASPNIFRRIKQNRFTDINRIPSQLELLLLKRRADADPLPGAWTAVSGRLQMNVNRGGWESPVRSAVREIGEETGQAVYDLHLQAALQPYALEAGDKKWQIWPMLWVGSGKRWDEQGRLKKRVLLNEENVDWVWDKVERLESLPGIVPGLMDTYHELVAAWIATEKARVERKKEEQSIDKGVHVVAR